MKNRRYPGVSPFTTEQNSIFFGRENDVKKIQKVIQLRKQLLLYSKSGVGKTSLLNAGLIPLIEHEYIVIKIRFFAYDEKDTQSPVDKICFAIQKADENRIETENFDLLLNKINNKESLWYYFKKLNFKNTEKQKYLLIFDQFEELFTYPAIQINQFKEQIHDILDNLIPSELMQYFSENSELYEKNGFDFLCSDLEIKTIYSIRSDRLSLLNALSDKIPDIQETYYELNPLTYAQVEEAIVNPAKSANNGYDSPVFSFLPETIEKIINELSNNKKQSIETTQLQIVCEQIEKIAKNKDASKLKNDTLFIELQDLPKFDAIFFNFYEEALRRLTKQEENKARLFIEDQLIRNYQRISLDELICVDYLNKEALQKLVATHLIRSEKNSTGGVSYELSHDTLVTPILNSKKARNEIEAKIRLEEERLEEVRFLKEKAEKEKFERDKERKQQKRIITIVGFAAIIALAFAIFGFVMWRTAQSKKLEVEAKSFELEKQKNALQKQQILLQASNDELIKRSLTEAVAKFEKYISDAQNLTDKGNFGEAIEKYKTALDQIKLYHYKDSVIAIAGIKNCNEKMLSNAEFDNLMRRADDMVAKNKESNFVDAMELYKKALLTNSNGNLANAKIMELQKMIDDRFKDYYDKAMDAMALNNLAGRNRAVELLQKALVLKPANNLALQKLNELK